MNKWLQFQLNRGQVNGKHLINPDNFLQMHTPQIVKPFSVLEKSEVMHPSDGIGWEIDSYRGHYRVHQGGASAIQSYASEITLFPHENLGIVVLTNAFLPLTVVLSNFISDMLLDIEPVDWNKRYMSMWFERRSAGSEEPAEETKPVHMLRDYAGAYKHPAYGIVKITLEDNSVKAEFHGRENTLKHCHFEVLEADNNRKFTFYTNNKGEVDRISIPLERAVNDIVFVRSTSNSK